MPSFPDMTSIALVGTGATAVLDAGAAASQTRASSFRYSGASWAQWAAARCCWASN